MSQRRREQGRAGASVENKLEWSKVVHLYREQKERLRATRDPECNARPRGGGRWSIVGQHDVESQKKIEWRRRARSSFRSPREKRAPRLPPISGRILLPALHRILFPILAGLLVGSSAVVRAEVPLREQSEQFFPLALNGTITLENTDGSIHIYGWNEPRVRLAALCKAYSASRLRQIRVETRAEPAILAVRTVVPKVSGWFADRSGTVDYTLTVPAAAQLRLKLANGEVVLQGLRGAKVDIALVNGRITALNCYAQIRANSSNGVMEAFFEWWENLPAKFDYALQRGRIGVRLPAGARFRVDARSDNGRIHQEFKFGAPADVGPGQVLEAATVPDAPVSLGLRTGSGNISLDAIR